MIEILLIASTAFFYPLLIVAVLKSIELIKDAAVQDKYDHILYGKFD